MKFNFTKLTLLFIVVISSYYQANAQEHFELRVLKGDSVHLSLGIPYDNDPSDDYHILRHQYAISYNQFKGVPNWVSYELNASWFGDAPRFSGNFITDTSLPDGFIRVRHADYTNTGFDRGHMVRSEERTRNNEDNRSTFILTNIIPQRPDLNRGPWLKFEYFCEHLSKKENKQLFIITGPIHTECHIDTNMRVSFPESCFKIVVVLDSGQNITHINKNTTIVSVIMPNNINIRNDNWQKYLVSVRKVEEATGYNFLSFLPRALQEELENKIYEE